MLNEAGRTVWSRIGRGLFILALLIFVAFPIVWLALGSVKSRDAALALPPELVFQPDFSAYAKIMSQGFLGSFRNSLTIALTNVVLTLVLATPAAYALTRMRGRVQENLSFWLLSVRMAPLFAVILPLYVLFKSIGLLDTRLAVALAHLTLTLPMAVNLVESNFCGVNSGSMSAMRASVPMTEPSLGAME